MSDSWMGLIWFAVLLVANAFFVGAEFAVLSARRAQIEPRADAGSKPAKITIKAMESVSLMLATAQLGITLCSLAILLIVEPSIHDLLKPLMVGLPYEVGYAVSFAIALIAVTFMHVVFGEMVPKNIAFSIPERAALVLAPLLYLVAQFVRPIVLTLNAIANGVLKMLKIEIRDEAFNAYTLDQVEDIVEHSTREGVLNDSSGALSNAFEFTEKKVRDISVAPANLVSFDESVTPREIEQAVAKHGFSRYPLTSDNNEIVGYVHLKDVIDLRDDEVDDAIPAKRIRTLISLPATMELEDALASMKRVGAHMARSFDRSGKLVGVLFLEDILEELVGEVQDATQRD
jgi:CBS domain containing-hemolysin-like protein